MKIDAERLANRARCLYVMFLRGCAEAKLMKRGSGLVPRGGGSAHHWLSLCDQAVQDPAIAGSFSPVELELLRIKGGKMKLFQAIYCVYCADSLDPLAQALGGKELERAPGDKAWFASVIAPKSMLGTKRPRWLAKPRVIPADDIEVLTEITTAYAWRLRLHVLTLTSAFRSLKDPFAPDPELDEFIAGLVAKRAAKCEQQGLFKPIRGDFPMRRTTFGKYIRRNMVSAWREESEMTQRVRAVRWMLNERAEWDTTRAPTPPGFAISKRLRGAFYLIGTRSHFNPDVDLISFRYR